MSEDDQNMTGNWQTQPDAESPSGSQVSNSSLPKPASAPIETSKTMAEENDDKVIVDSTLIHARRLSHDFEDAPETADTPDTGMMTQEETDSFTPRRARKALQFSDNDDDNNHADNQSVGSSESDSSLSSQESIMLTLSERRLQNDERNANFLSFLDSKYEKVVSKAKAKGTGQEVDDEDVEEDRPQKELGPPRGMLVKMNTSIDLQTKDSTLTPTNAAKSLQTRYPHRESQIRLLTSLLSATMTQASQYSPDSNIPAYVPAPIFVTGPAGTGKSAICRDVVDALDKAASGVASAYVNCAILEPSSIDRLVSSAYSQLKPIELDANPNPRRRKRKHKYVSIKEVPARVQAVSNAEDAVAGDGQGNDKHTTTAEEIEDPSIQKSAEPVSTKEVPAKVQAVSNAEDAVAGNSQKNDEHTTTTEEIEGPKVQKSAEPVSTKEVPAKVQAVSNAEGAVAGDSQENGKHTTTTTEAIEGPKVQKSAEPGATDAPMNAEVPNQDEEKDEQEAELNKRIQPGRRAKADNIPSGSAQVAGKENVNKIGSMMAKSNEAGGKVESSWTTHAAVVALGRALKPYYGRESKSCAFLVLDHAERLLSLSIKKAGNEQTNYLAELLLLPKVMELNLTIIVITNNCVLDSSRKFLYWDPCLSLYVSLACLPDSSSFHRIKTGLNNIVAAGKSHASLSNGLHPYRIKFTAYKGIDVFKKVSTSPRRTHLASVLRTMNSLFDVDPSRSGCFETYCWRRERRCISFGIPGKGEGVISEHTSPVLVGFYKGYPRICPTWAIALAFLYQTPSSFLHRKDDGFDTQIYINLS